MSDVGNSGTPLIKKLGFKPPLEIWVVNVPAEYREWLGGLPEGVTLIKKISGPIKAVHLFTTKSSELNAALSMLRRELEQGGFIWVSWPKKSSKVATDVTEDTIREIALPLGFVDIKVCAVNEVWSGLKLVIRRSQRS